MLLIELSDDGGGISLDRLRVEVVQRKLTNAETAARLSEAELLEFCSCPASARAKSPRFPDAAWGWT